MKRENSNKFYKKALELFPKGVNSPVRAFQAVFGYPIFIVRGEGSRTWDADGNEFIDFCCSWGPLILGHNNKKVREKIIETTMNGTSFGTPTLQENELGDLILKNNSKIEKIRFVNSGTEAVMSAVRLARGYTGRDKILKFSGCYHGHVDSLLVKAGSGLATFGESSSAGVPQSFTKETIVCELNNKETVEKAFEEFGKDIACILIEPIPANNGLLLQDKDYLEFLREITKKNGSLLIFDEVISGFRVGFEGAAGYYGIQPDIVTYGKIIGGGMPVGAYGASREIMSFVAPEGPVYQAGTLSGNPVAMAAGAAQVAQCLEPNFYEKLECKTQNFVNEINDFAKINSLEVKVFSIGSIFWFAFTNLEKVSKAEEIEPQSMEIYKIFHNELLERGIYFAPSGYEVGFISVAHSEEDLRITVKAVKESLEVALKS